MMPLILAMLVLLALHVAVMPAEAEEGTYYYVAISASTSHLNVRSEPSTDSSVVATRIRGDMVYATGDASGAWVEVRIEPVVGWVQLTMLSLEEPYDDVRGVIAADGRVSLRESPGGERIRWVQPGQEVAVMAVLECDGERWYRVRCGEERGWVLGECLELVQ